ncbi:Nitrogen permease reactivator protein [Podochytrium sp. JEL0797]|nr:Nitrogen permease reactivator protein [Podochytrium sp. JEL0797]
METKEIKFSQTATVTRCRTIKETKLKAQQAVVKLFDEESTICTANLESELHRLKTQLADNCAIDERQLETARDTEFSWERKLQLNKLVDKLTAIKSLLRFQEEAREREAAFKSSTRQKRAAFHARSARMEQRHTAERSELLFSQRRLAETVRRINAIEIKNIKDQNQARKALKENESQAQLAAMRQQKESEFLRELQLCRVRHTTELNDLEIMNMEELEDLGTQHRLEEFNLLSKSANSEFELLTSIKIQKHRQEALELTEYQKSVQAAFARAQRKQAASAAKSYAVACRNREKMMIGDHPIIKSDDNEDEMVNKLKSDGSKPLMNLASEENAIIKISGERSNVGVIMHTNENFNTLFGYPNGEAVGKNIDIIVPSPFSEMHDGLLKKYLDTGAARVIDAFQTVMGIHKQGHLLPIVLCVKHNKNTDGTRAFAGFIKALPPSATSGYLIFDANTLRVNYATKNVEDTFQFRNAKTGAPPVVMADLFPGLDAKAVKQVSSGGFHTEVKKGDNVLDVVVKGDRMQVVEFALIICRVTFRSKSDQDVKEVHDDDPLPMTFYEEEETGEGREEEDTNGLSEKVHSDVERDMSEAGAERVNALVAHNKTVFNELKRQHRSSVSQKTKEIRKKVSELLKDHEEEIETLKIDQSATMTELLDTQLQSEELRAELEGSNKLTGVTSLPYHIMQKMESGVQPEPEHFNYVAGFKNLDPTKALQFLNELTPRFEEIIAKFPHLHKVDSFLDSWIVAAGLSASQESTPEERADCAAQALQCCTEMKNLVKEFHLRGVAGNQQIALRVGIHSGAVHAGLVGRRNHYSLIGETFDIAAQMCATSDADNVQVSVKTIEALGDNENFEFEVKGDVHIKGQGKIPVYLLI